MQLSKRCAYGATLAVLAATWVAPRWPLEQAMHGSLTIIALVWLWVHERKYPLKPLYFAFICLFLGVHSLAARWLYSYVPYEAWFVWLINWSPEQAFGWRRNHFDRLIHFLYGICFTPALYQYVRQKYAGLRFMYAYCLAVAAIMCSSMIYEWLEWGIALLLSPQAAEAYNGQQGDVWDAHADMLLATLGALAAWPVLRLERKQQQK